ncbi:MAG: 5-formyltetrahydrofolate cyclo-ligase [Burkholderiales bacterium]|nr:5-formyltetrahydrofolate cyclo-ligase [Burkholderiales bacterium]
MASDPAPSVNALTGLELHEAKRAMRTRIVAARDALARQARETATAAIAARVADLPSFRHARCALLTLPFRSEWDTTALFAAALAEGKTIAMPRVDTVSRMLDLHTVHDIARDTAPGYRGIPEPNPRLPRVAVGDVEWVLVPGVAFDLQGRRLGYGGGFYDRLLAMVRKGVPRVAGAFDVQVVDAVPAAPHDLAVDVIATESRILIIRVDGES